MKIQLKDGSVKEYAESKSVIDIALDISEGLARAACAGEVDGQIVDLRTVLDKDCTLNILTARDPEGFVSYAIPAPMFWQKQSNACSRMPNWQSDLLLTLVSTMILRLNPFQEKT